MDVGLTVCLGLGAGVAGRAQEAHIRVRDAGYPGEIDGVNIVEGQTAHMNTRIDPGHISAAGRHKNTPDKQKKDSAAVNILKLAERHMVEIEIVTFLETNSLVLQGRCLEER